MKRAIRDMNHTEALKLFRGADVTTGEIEMMKDAGVFFMPNFISTSKSPDSAFNKNSVLVIDKPANVGFCTDLGGISHYSNEQEILLSCYNVYLYERHELVDGKTYIFLTVGDYDKYCRRGEPALQEAVLPKSLAPRSTQDCLIL
eukprot:TRINITY_DN30054_c0_g5_i1.p1 TRINITY_DN30054_c0_g5~~TRINITY_DN30054_c0_g5_i1.p1  ORF type:complete len:145 (-),score=28.95 TRINITY_DN30054_c0_g5_i1:54-488(-)